MRIVGCFLEYGGKFVILLRHSHKPHGGTWGLPGGKVEPGETDETAIIRELFEETGYHAEQSELEKVGVFKFHNGGKVYDYVTFRVKLDMELKIIIEESAHTNFKWVSAEECFARNDLIHDLHDLLISISYVNPKGVNKRLKNAPQ